MSLLPLGLLQHLKQFVKIGRLAKGYTAMAMFPMAVWLSGREAVCWMRPQLTLCIGKILTF